MWFTGANAEVAVQCRHCKARDWRTAGELRAGRMFCFFCARFSDWPPKSAERTNVRGPEPAPGLMVSHHRVQPGP